MVIYIDTFNELKLDGVMFGKIKNWLLVISTKRDIVHVFTTTDERALKGMMVNSIKNDQNKAVCDTR
jgi:hypothetical protein